MRKTFVTRFPTFFSDPNGAAITEEATVKKKMHFFSFSEKVKIRKCASSFTHLRKRMPANDVRAFPTVSVSWCEIR